MATPVNNAKRRFEGLDTRIVSAIVLACIALLLTIAGGIWFSALVISAALLMHDEWQGLTDGSRKWKVLGFAYVLAPCISLLWLRGFVSPHSFPGDEPHDSGLAIVLYVLCVVWATDIGAYFAGRMIGGAKIAPSVSPNKTWAGLLGGMLAAALVGVIISFFTPYPNSFFNAIGTSMLLAIIAQTGDFFESWLKRRAGVKDSGMLIPGHGGILDRVDGLVFAAPVYAIMVYANI